MEIKKSFQRGAEIWGRIIIPKDWVMSGREMPSDHLFPYLPIHPNTKSNSFAPKWIGSGRDVKIVNQRRATSCFTGVFSYLGKIGEFWYLVYFLYDPAMKPFLLLTDRCICTAVRNGNAFIEV